MMRKGLIAGFAASLLLSALALVGHSSGSDDAPPWLRQAASLVIPTYDKEVPAVVLVKEQNVAVDNEGRQKTLTRGALKILKREGRELAVIRTVYRAGGERVREINAWLIPPSGRVRKYGKREVLEMAAATGDMYSELRVKAVSAAGEAETGAVFGYEILNDETPLFNQLEWEFQERLPVIQSRITLQLPDNWRVESTTFNHAAVKPDASGGQYTWELRNLPFIKHEPASPSLSNLAPRLGISYFPPPGSNRTSGRAFQSWSDVASWVAELHDPQAVSSEAIAAKVAELTANAKSESDRIRAIARYIQDIRYVSIQTGLGRGGGYLPHAASEVFSKSYGDCKDKATLMRAMLKAAGIQSYSVVIYSLDSRYVREEWPTPQQFDHVIVAIAIHADSFPAMALTHPQFGRLLFFDPTDPDTGCGDLPEDEQGSLALLAAPQGGSLIRTPSSAPEANLIERQIEVTLDGQGAIVGRIHEQATGQAGASYRQEYRANPGSKYKEVLESWIAGSVNGAQISKFTPVTESGDGTFATEIEFSANDYGQLMQNRLLIFRPVLVSRRDKLSLTELSRTSPVVLEAHAFTERSRFKLPEGFAVEEPPAAVQFEAPFGTYAANVEVRQGDVLFTRRLVLKGQIIPVDQYTTLRRFFENIRTAEQAPIVLVRK